MGIEAAKACKMTNSSSGEFGKGLGHYVTDLSAHVCFLRNLERTLICKFTL